MTCRGLIWADWLPCEKHPSPTLPCVLRKGGADREALIGFLAKGTPPQPSPARCAREGADCAVLIGFLAKGTSPQPSPARCAREGADRAVLRLLLALPPFAEGKGRVGEGCFCSRSTRRSPYFFNLYANT